MAHRIEVRKAMDPWRRALALVRREALAIRHEQLDEGPARPFKVTAEKWLGNGHRRSVPESWPRGPYKKRSGKEK